MIRKLEVRNFKRFRHATFELDDQIVMVGPNNCGKTTVLQAIALWAEAWHHWIQDDEASGWLRGESEDAMRMGDGGYVPTLLDGVHSVAVTTLVHLWHDREVSEPIVLAIHTEEWKVALELAFKTSGTMAVRPADAVGVQELRICGLDPFSAVYIPSSLQIEETESILEEDVLRIRLSRGGGATVLRNMLLRLSESRDKWETLTTEIHALFGYGVRDPSRGEPLNAFYRHSEDHNWLENLRRQRSSANRDPPKRLRPISDVAGFDPSRRPQNAEAFDKGDLRNCQARQRENLGVVETENPFFCNRVDRPGTGPALGKNAGLGQPHAQSVDGRVVLGHVKALGSQEFGQRVAGDAQVVLLHLQNGFHDPEPAAVEENMPGESVVERWARPYRQLFCQVRRAILSGRQKAVLHGGLQWELGPSLGRHLPHRADPNGRLPYRYCQGFLVAGVPNRRVQEVRQRHQVGENWLPTGIRLAGRAGTVSSVPRATGERRGRRRPFVPATGPGPAPVRPRTPRRPGGLDGRCGRRAWRGA